MATLTKDPSGLYTVKQGDTLSRVAASQGRSLSDLLSQNPQYASNPNLIRPGDTIKFGDPSSTTSSTPSYSDLVSGPSKQVAPKMGFTEALTAILKDAQKTQQTGTANLMKQKQNITATGLNQASNVSNMQELTPQGRIALRNDAMSAVNPGELSVNNQIQLANQGFSQVNDLVSQTGDNYQKEQDRIQRIAEQKADEAYRNAVLEETKRSNRAQEGINRQKAGGSNLGGGTTEFTDAQIKKIESSPEAKKLLALKDLEGKLNAYRTVASQEGKFDMTGSRKAIADSLYADLKIAYKEAANLGALTGPDVAIIQEAIKPTSGGLGKLIGYKTGGGQAGVLGSIDTALQTLQRQRTNNAATLTSKWGNTDPYIVQLIGEEGSSGEIVTGPDGNDYQIID